MANYTVNAYNNGGTGGSVNMRSGPSTNDGIVVRVPHGATVTGTKSGTWSYMTYNTYTGYMMSVYLDEQSGGSTGGGAYLGTGTVIGGGPLYCRKQPIAGYEAWGQFQEGATIQIYSCSTSGWYETRWNGSNVGYVMSAYVDMNSGGTGGGTYIGTGTVIGGGPLFCRKQPIAGYEAWGQFQEDATIQLYSCSTPGWYETRWNGNNIGYVMSNYIKVDGSGTIGGAYLGNGTVIGGGPLYCRKQPIAGYESWGQFQEGATIQIYTCSTSGWYETRWNGNNVGYVMTAYVDMSGSGGSIDEGTYIGTGTVIGGGPLYCRKQPIAGYESWGQFQEGTTIQIYTCSTSGWYETRWPVGGSNVGYVMANYVSTSGGGSSGGSTVTFNPSAAVAYAKGHSETTENALCSNRNTSFGSSTNNDCANFVSQCLVAGGLPMFDGWCYKVSGIPSSWNTGGWTWTYSGYQALNRKGRVSAVALSNVKPGDFIYNYDHSQPAGKQYTHAMLAVSTYKNGGVDICGHTRNQNTVFKSFNSSNCKCYRVNPTITIGPDEKRVTLPATGSGATVH